MLYSKYSNTLTYGLLSSFLALPLEDLITCITFDGPRPYGAKYVFVDKVEIETDPDICNVSGNCGYFDSRKEAHLEIPFFAGNQFSKFAYR